jgi:hypothetical protein
MARKPRADKGKKRGKRSPIKQRKTKKVKKEVQKTKEEVKMPKQEIESQEFPMLTKLSTELVKLLEALKAGTPVVVTDDEEAEEKETPKAKKVVEDDEDESEKEDAEESDDDEDEDDEDEDEDEDDEEEAEEKKESSEDEIELDLDKLDSMDKEKLVEIAEKIGIKKPSKMKEKELRAEIIKKATEQNEVEEADDDEDDEDEDEKPAAKKWAVGDKILGLYNDGKGKYYKAIITKVLPGGKYEVKWKDGDTKHTTVSDVKERKVAA